MNTTLCMQSSVHFPGFDSMQQMRQVQEAQPVNPGRSPPVQVSSMRHRASLQRRSLSGEVRNQPKVLPSKHTAIYLVSHL